MSTSTRLSRKKIKYNPVEPYKVHLQRVWKYSRPNIFLEIYLIWKLFKLNSPTFFKNISKKQLKKSTLIKNVLFTILTSPQILYNLKITRLATWCRLPQLTSTPNLTMLITWMDRSLQREKYTKSYIWQWLISQ